MTFSFIDEYVAGSGYPYSVNQIEKMYNDGITDIVTLTPSSPSSVVKDSGRPINVHHFPTLTVPHKDNISTILNLIEDGKKEGRKFMIHCQYGQERTGIVLAAYLEKSRKLDKQAAIDLLHKLRPSSLKSRNSVAYFISLDLTD